MKKINTTTGTGEKRMSFGGTILALLVLVNAVILYRGMINEQWYQALLLTLPLLVLASWNAYQGKHVRIIRRSRKRNMNKSLN